MIFCKGKVAHKGDILGPFLLAIFLHFHQNKKFQKTICRRYFKFQKWFDVDVLTFKFTFDLHILAFFGPSFGYFFQKLANFFK